MQWIDGRRYEAKARVERCSRVAFGVNSKRTHAGKFRDLERTLHGMTQEACSDAAAVPFPRHCKTSENDKRNGMPREALRYTLRSLQVHDMASDERMITDDSAVVQRDIGARRICLLRLKSVDDEKTV